MHTATRTHTLRTALVLAGALLLAVGCTNPLSVGLGDEVDIDRPDGEVQGPGSGNYLRGTVVLEGTHSDDTTALPAVTLSFDAGATSVEAEVTAEGWSYSYDSTTRPDGELELLVTITDDSGKSTEKRRLYYVDNTAPLVLMKNPQNYATNNYNGDVTVRGETADLFAIDRVTVQVLDENGDAISGLDEADGTNSWSFTFDSRNYADPAGTLRLAVVATDRAGNSSTMIAHYDDVLDANDGQSITVENLRRVAAGESVDGAVITTSQIQAIGMANVPVEIDNDLDKPIVSFASPENGQSVGGSILVTGTAIDDDGLERVEMRLDLNGDGDFTDAFDLNADGDTADEYETEANWVTLAGTVLWTQDLNADGELYQVESGHGGQVAIQVRATDINGLVGNTVEIAIRFDDTIPRVESLAVDSRVFIPGLSVRGTTTLTASIRDDEQVNRVRVSYDGGITYTDIFNRSSATNDGSITENAPNDLSLAKTINTHNVPGIGALSSEPLYVRLLVFDNNSPTPYQVVTYITLNVDNIYPSGGWNALAADPQEIDGAAAVVQGVAEDTGTVSGIDAIHVYFARSGQVYNLTDGTTQAAASESFSDAGGSVATFDYAPTAAHRIVIDNELEDGNDGGAAGDGDGFDESLTVSGTEWTWWAAFDSTLIPDGRVEIHFVVFDSAGNGTHYLVSDPDGVPPEGGFIKNNRPSITGLTVGTDLDYDNTVEAGEQFSYAGSFSAHNRLYVDIDASDTAGGIASYRVFRDLGDPSTNPEIAPALGAYETGAEIDITGETEDAVVDLYALVTDTDGITSRTDFSFTVDNIDSVAPAGSLDAFEQTSVVDGHVEAAGAARDFGGYDGSFVADADADVSGTIAVSGAASDDQRVNEIYLTITGHDGDGAGATYVAGDEFLVASWDPTDGRLEYNTALGFAADTPLSQTLSTATGHDATFSIEWNTALLQDEGTLADITALEDVNVVLRVTDFGTAADASDGLTVDVVPYVDGIARTDAVSLTRTKFGRYSLPEGLTNLEIRGFNLNPDWVRIYNSAGTASTALTAAGVSSPYTSFQIDLATNHSGSLWLEVNGVAAINNYNDNSLTQTREDDGSGIGSTLWTDDRFIDLWDVDNDFQDSTEAQLGAFTVNQSTGEPYASWSEYSASRAYWGTDTTRNTLFDLYDPPEWTEVATNEDGRPYVAYLANFFGGNGNRWGGLVLWGDNADYNNNRNPDGDGQTGDAQDIQNPEYREYFANAEEIEWLANDDILFQFRNPRIAVTGTNADTTIIVSYYDSYSKALKFAQFRDTGGNIYNNTLDLATNATTDNPRYSPDNDENVVDGTADPATGDDVGLYSDIGIDQLGRPVIVYYDTSNTTLKLARATSADPTNHASDWVIQDVFQGGDPNRLFAGLYVSLEIDTSGNLHVVAYRNSSGDLIYLSAPAAADGETYSFGLSSVVDSEGSVGTWSELSLVGGVPHIAYVDGSQVGTFYGLKYAYLDGSEWEYGTVPAQVAVQGQRVGIESNPTTGLAAADDYVVALGYNAGNYYFARLRPEQ